MWCLFLRLQVTGKVFLQAGLKKTKLSTNTEQNKKLFPLTKLAKNWKRKSFLWLNITNPQTCIQPRLQKYHVSCSRFFYCFFLISGGIFFQPFIGIVMFSGIIYPKTISELSTLVLSNSINAFLPIIESRSLLHIKFE